MSFLSQSLSENRCTVALASPIVAGYLAQMLMGWVDTIMVGHIGVVPLAACAFANTVLAVPMVVGFGLLSSVSVRASHAHGAEDNARLGEILRAATLLAALAGLLVASAIQFSIPFLPLLGQKPEVNTACVNFLLLCGWSVIPIFLTCAGKNFSEALARPWIPFWIMISSVLLNIALNWVFIYGNLGFPAMGLDGAGLATLIARIAAAAGVFSYLYLSPYFRLALPRRWFAPGLHSHFRALLVIGLPAGAMHFSEVSGFAFASIMMGWIGVDALAAHQIAITCAATTFMIPLGLAQAVSVRVGHSRGSDDLARCKPIIYGALGLAVVLMMFFTATFVSLGTQISSLFIDIPSVVALAAHLLLFVGFFQTFDGIQVVCAGALRGFEDTRVPMVFGFISFWGVALPVSYLFGFVLNAGASGIWLGLVCGLFVSAVALLSRVRFRLASAKSDPAISHALPR